MVKEKGGYFYNISTEQQSWISSIATVNKSYEYLKNAIWHFANFNGKIATKKINLERLITINYV